MSFHFTSKRHVSIYKQHVALALHDPIRSASSPWCPRNFSIKIIHKLLKTGVTLKAHSLISTIEAVFFVNFPFCNPLQASQFSKSLLFFLGNWRFVLFSSCWGQLIAINKYDWWSWLSDMCPMRHNQQPLPVQGARSDSWVRGVCGRRGGGMASGGSCFSL